MTFLERLNEFRAEKNLTILQVAQGAKIPYSTLASYISRGSIPSMTQLIALSDFFECSIDYLVGREDDFGVTAPMHDELRSDELELIKLYNELPELRREVILDSMRGMIKLNQNKNIG